MAARPTQLDLYLDAQLAGVLHDTSPLAFAYAPGWLAQPRPMAVAAIALQPGLQSGPAVLAFFENLLPEGELRQYLAQQKKASTLFSLLLEVAGDTAGAFVMLPAGQAPAAPRYEPTTWEALAQRLNAPLAAAMDLASEGARISLAGAQDKASLAIFGDGAPRLPQGTAPSTHILKPDIRRLGQVWQSAANEAIVMRAAALCGLPTAEVFYEPVTQSCVVRRFDRTLRADGSLGRLVQYDMCQLVGTVSEHKYEKEGGPSLAACAELVRRYSSQPALDLRELLRWVFFNLYVGNNDSHAKNLSVYYRPEQGVRLTPFYDLMCTRLYPGLSPEFAFAIGGETLPGAIGRAQIDGMAVALRMQPAFVRKVAADMAQVLPGAIAQAAEAMAPLLPRAAHSLSERLLAFVATTTRKTAARIAGAGGL
ncbi:type II toxin-antitoxin system HipA family toxin [Xylophilus sp. GW821-FHT01B05]